MEQNQPAIRNNFSIKKFVKNYLDLRKDKDNEKEA